MNLTLTRFTALAATLLLTTALTPTPALAHQTPAATTCNLVIHIDGFRNQKGDAGISVFNSPEGWPEDNNKAFLHGPYPFTGTSTTITVQVPPGHYAVAALHDENSNHKLDRNMFGIPKEGFGFTNNPKVFLSAPSFDTAAMQVSCPTTETTIHLIYK
ncbi:MAG: DUF2141 domain-containing protein [Acidobacteriaceae bacterium]